MDRPCHDRRVSFLSSWADSVRSGIGWWTKGASGAREVKGSAPSSLAQLPGSQNLGRYKVIQAKATK